MREWPDLPELVALRQAARGGAADGSRWAVLEHSLTWVTAHDADTLVGFVNVA